MGRIDLATALQRRKEEREKLQRYVHTRSFNHLAGNRLAESRRGAGLNGNEARIIFAVFFLLLWFVGFWFLVY